MGNILLVDTNFSSAPIYDHLINIGHEVYVCGNNPEDFLAKYVEKYIQINYSDIPLMRKLINELSIDYIVPGCNDRSYQTCSVLSQEFNFCGMDNQETTELLNNKYKFRTYVGRASLPAPRLIGDLARKKLPPTPYIVKPVDAFSGRGITIVKSKVGSELEKAIDVAKQYSPTNSYVIEQFVSGQLYSHSAFISKQQIQTDFIVKEYGSANPFVVDSSFVQADFDKVLLNRIRSAVTYIAQDLNLVDGLFHTQFICNGDEFWIIEVTRRCPGDLYSYLIELSTGYPYAQAYAFNFINKRMPLPILKNSNLLILRHTISQPIESIFKSIRFNQPVCIERFVPLHVIGDNVPASPFGRIGLVFIESKTLDELVATLQLVLDRRLYKLN